MVLSFHVALRDTSQAITLLSTAFFFIGVADFFATNTAFSILSLSRQYAAARTEEERAIFLAAGQAMFTLFNENAFLVSYFIISASWMMMSFVMLRSRFFGNTTAYAGILAGAAGMVAVILEHISEGLAMVAIFFYFAAILFLFIWVILSGNRLLQLATRAGNW